MPLYVADYMADTAHLTVAEHGAYLLLIMNYWHNGGLPDDDAKLQRIAHMSTRQWAKSKVTLKAYFTETWKHKRIDLEIAQVIEISEKRAASARQKHSKSTANADTPHTTHPTSTEPSGSGADAPSASNEFRSPSAILFTEGLRYLEKHGSKEKHARGLIGGWKRDYGDAAVIDALSSAMRQEITEPVAWIIQVLKTKKPNGNGYGKQSELSASFDSLEERIRQQPGFVAG